MKLYTAFAVAILAGCEGTPPEESVPTATAIVECDVVEPSAPTPTPPVPPPMSDHAYTRTGSDVGVTGDHLVAEARCDEGDLAISGGCTWGKRSATVRPAADGPSLDSAGIPRGWVCDGVADDDLIGQTAITATVICLTS